MIRKIHNLVQGSSEWHAYRAKHFNASDCPAMLGVSSYKSRDALLKEKATGIAPEIDVHTQRIFNAGHEFEKMARQIACGIIGDDLYPITVSLELDGLNLSASLDGITIDDITAWEHKTLNQKIEEAVLGGEIPEQYRAQMEMQMLVSGAKQCLFMASRGTADTEIHKWYESDPVMRDRIVSGWKQFAIDLANYVLPEAESPKAIAEPVPALPAIKYEIDLTKGITIHSNMDAFKLAAQELVKMSECALVTDQDFENAKARIKECEKAEKNIDSLIERVLGDLGDANKFKQDMESIKEWIRKSRLNQANKVASRDKDRRREIVQDGENTLSAFIATVNEKLAPIYLPAIKADFAAAIKGKSKFENMISAVNDEVARAKIEANQLAEKITNNIQLLRMIAGEYMELFADLQTICVKDADYIKAIAKQRVDQHKADEQARIQAEAKRIADEQIEKDRQAELAKAQAAAVEAVKPLQAEIPKIEPVAGINTPQNFSHDEYEHFMSTSDNASFEQSFNEVFGGDSVEPMVDLSDFQKGFNAGRIAGLDLALAIFIKHGASGFAKAVQDFIEVGAPETVSKAA